MTDRNPWPPHVSDVPGFWDRVAMAPSRMLILDYDGTLAPFVVDRMAAFPLDGITETLCAIRESGTTRLAIVTGRPIDELLELLGDLEIPVVGSQGAEFRRPNGHWFTMLPSARQRARLLQAEQEALTFAPEECVEKKPASVALHTRGMAASKARASEEALRKLWTRDAEQNGLECRSFLGGVEFRLKETTKGTAINALTKECAPDDLIVYIGDDDTDEDAFAALKGRGLSIRVGDAATTTAADVRLCDTSDVRWFLVKWLDVTNA